MSLSDFYKSKDWQGLLKVIKLERLNNSGELICAYCGKPIVKAYDCIGHHKTYLTEENYTDALISLNSDNIDLVHHRCHNKIHDKLGYSKRQVYLVYGSPLSGKSSYVSNVALPGDLIIDIDRIWWALSGQPMYIKPNRLKANVFTVRDNLLDQVRYRTGKWLNAYVIGGYPFTAERERLVSSLGAREIFIDTAKEECMNRLYSAEDRDIDQWKKYIDDWFLQNSGAW